MLVENGCQETVGVFVPKSFEVERVKNVIADFKFLLGWGDVLSNERWGFFFWEDEVWEKFWTRTDEKWTFVILRKQFPSISIIIRIPMMILHKIRLITWNLHKHQFRVNILQHVFNQRTMYIWIPVHPHNDHLPFWLLVLQPSDLHILGQHVLQFLPSRFFINFEIFWARQKF